MKVTSTEFRRNLFQLVESALRGEFVEVAHKGRVVRLVPDEASGKMARLVPRETIRGTVEDLERAQRELDEESGSLWEKKWPVRG